ncbi:hypothetical protein HOD38_05790 [archaeon]|jgi:hypothetical protein|nr:hypothetical protein [archaeon]MBT4397749.1 hypothetical protein [archaeon]MBT4441230.1 hypothetical protein [archaeon]
MHDEDEDKALGELKRVDHLIYVTLKYTRTVDVIRTVIEKLISTFNNQSESMFTTFLDDKKVSYIPTVPLVRMKDLEKHYKKDKQVKNIIDFYMLLKRIYNAEYKAKEEYRKNVTLVTRDNEVNIELLKTYYELTQEYISYLNNINK